MRSERKTQDCSAQQLPSPWRRERRRRLVEQHSIVAMTGIYVWVRTVRSLQFFLPALDVDLDPYPVYADLCLEVIEMLSENDQIRYDFRFRSPLYCHCLSSVSIDSVIFARKESERTTWKPYFKTHASMEKWVFPCRDQEKMNGFSGWQGSNYSRTRFFSQVCSTEPRIWRRQAELKCF